MPPGLSRLTARFPTYQNVQYARHNSHSLTPTTARPHSYSSVQADGAAPSPRIGSAPIPRILNHTSPLDLLRPDMYARVPPKVSDGILAELGASLDMSAFHSRPKDPPMPEKRDARGPMSTRSSKSTRRIGYDRANERIHGKRLMKSSTEGPTPPTLTEMPPNCKDRWDPSKKLVRSAMDRIRFLYKQDPQTFSAAALSKAYGIGYEAVKRILRSKYVPSSTRANEIDQRRELVKATWRRVRHLGRGIDPGGGPPRHDSRRVDREPAAGARSSCSVPKSGVREKDGLANRSTLVGVRTQPNNWAIQSDHSGDEWGWLK